MDDLSDLKSDTATVVDSDMVIDPNPELYPHKTFEGDEKFFKPVYVSRKVLAARNKNYLSISIKGDTDD